MKALGDRGLKISRNRTKFCGKIDIKARHQKKKILKRMDKFKYPI